MAAVGAANNASPIVSGTTPQSSSSSSSTANATNAMASQQIAGNFQSFLQLLTTQLQNQNPLDPLDTNQFTQQLVEFAGVQQQLNTNSSLSTLVSLQQTAQSTQALGFVGKTATVSGSTAALSNSVANWALDIPKNCTLTVTIANSSGQTVYTGNYSATAGNSQPFGWNGKGNDGTQWPDGQYKLTATAQDSSGNSVAVSTDVQGVVSSVDLTQTPPLLTIGGQTYTISQIKGISG
jgi:flagellar basal-body rod modification protein FlgD